MADELDKLFPLVSTSFERYMLADDRPSHPMAAFMEIDVRGRVQTELLLKAFDLAVDRHPLLRACTQPDRWGRPLWQLTSPRSPDVAGWGVPLTCSDAEGGGEQFDMRAGTGMRTWIRQAVDRTHITIQVHHACSDAVGKLTFLSDWLSLYTQLEGSDPARPL
ncbi:MAG: hypothetical protein KF861_18390, partial [Planctomycetaceae bacterium]|nr:hypothetical protein [Planctomycetaceae bacterium]